MAQKSDFVFIIMYGKNLSPPYSWVRDSPTSAPKGAKNESVPARQILHANEADIIKVLVC